MTIRPYVLELAIPLEMGPAKRVDASGEVTEISFLAEWLLTEELYPFLDVANEIVREVFYARNWRQAGENGEEEKLFHDVLVMAYGDFRRHAGIDGEHLVAREPLGEVFVTKDQEVFYVNERFAKRVTGSFAVRELLPCHGEVIGGLREHLYSALDAHLEKEVNSLSRIENLVERNAEIYAQALSYVVGRARLDRLSLEDLDELAMEVLEAMSDLGASTDR